MDSYSNLRPTTFHDKNAGGNEFGNYHNHKNSTSIPFCRDINWYDIYFMLPTLHVE